MRERLAALGMPGSNDVKRYSEAANMIDVAEAVTRSALYREESRSSHFRKDSSELRDDAWLQVTTVFGKSGNMQVSGRAPGSKL